jgi:hypothetical protein
LVGDQIDLDKFRHPQITPQEVTEATVVVMQSITGLVEQLRGAKAPGTLWDPAVAGQSVTGNFLKKKK